MRENHVEEERNKVSKGHNFLRQFICWDPYYFLLPCPSSLLFHLPHGVEQEVVWYCDWSRIWSNFNLKCLYVLMHVCLWLYPCTCTIFHLMLTKYLQRKEWWYFLLLFLRRVRDFFFLHTNALLFLMQLLSKCAGPPKWELLPTFLLWGLRALTFRACLYKHSLYFPLSPCRQREQTSWSWIHCI